MNVPLTSIVPARVEDRATTLATLVAAFAHDPAARTLYPEHDAYAAHFPGLAESVACRAFDEGLVDSYPAGLGAALWLPPGTALDAARIEAHLAATVPAPRLGAMAAGFAAQRALRPGKPHWYLPWIGVRPDAQAAGIGSILLRQGLARADADGMPAYVEATCRHNAALFARHGFRPVGLVLAPGYPQVTTMWRPARRI